MSTLHVSCAAEGSYVAHGAAMLHSVLVNAGQHVHVHYLHGPEFRSDWKSGLTGMVEREGCSISFYEIDDERCAGLPTDGFTRKATWYRIFLPELLGDVDRVLYLDSDLLVLGSLAPLLTIDLADHYVAAVTNVFQIDHLWRPAALGLSSPLEYFNAGVMLLNLDLMRHDGCGETLREYATAHAAELEWRDQDAVNVVLGPRRLPLAPRWNCMNSLLTFPWSAYVYGVPAFDEARGNPAIRHFEGPGSNKPWHYLCERNMRALYAHHRRHTPWPEFRLDGVTPLNVARRVSRSVRRVARRLRPEPRHDPSLADRDPAGRIGALGH